MPEAPAAVLALVRELSDQMSIRQACRLLVVPRSWYYRQREGPAKRPSPPATRPRPSHGLSESERVIVRAVLNSQRFVDQAPREVYATLLDEGVYLCHWRTMYRLLAEQGQVRERRNQRRQPVYKKPQLLAEGPRQIWSWDITWLKGPFRRLHYYLYVVLDIFSRYVVGWTVAERESASLAERLIAITCRKQDIAPEQLTLHADRGNPMRAKTMAELLLDLGVAKSHSRPYTPDDNPFSEAQFKTLKYRPDYPERFESLPQARAWARAFFDWYNHAHHHVSLGLMTPAVVHYGRTEAVRAQRQQVLDAAYRRHPERFIKGPPVASEPAKAVWINRPLDTGSSGAAPEESQPGAQTGSRNGAAVLEAGEHLATIGETLRPD